MLGEQVEFFFGDLIPQQCNKGTVNEGPLVSDIVRLCGDEAGNQPEALELVRCYLRIRSVEKRHAVLHLVKVLGSEP